MAKQMKGSVVTVLMIAGGILILLSILFIGISVYQTVRWGPCWASFNQNLGEVETSLEQKLMTQESDRVTVTMGECVGLLAFVNKEDLDEIETEGLSNALNCPSGEGFIIGLPYFEETASGLRFWRWHKDIAENIMKSWEEKVKGIGPLCKGLDKKFSELEPIKGPGEGKTKTLCLELSKLGDDKYGISYGVGACE